MPDTPAGRPLRVLVADDSPDAADALRLLLRGWGHEVRVAYDGLEALAIAPGFRPDVVLLDVRMPRLPGGEVAWRLRQLPPLAGTLIVCASGVYPDAESLADYRGYFDAFLPKPCDPQRLARLLQACPAAHPAR
jgi:two-component system, sensor histidine kinase